MFDSEDNQVRKYLKNCLLNLMVPIDIYLYIYDSHTHTHTYVVFKIPFDNWLPHFNDVIINKAMVFSSFFEMFF